MLKSIKNNPVTTTVLPLNELSIMTCSSKEGLTPSFNNSSIVSKCLEYL